ncbi:hypothetical protein [Aurantivibrio infirmus]
MSSQNADLAKEWSLLQNQFDSYEKLSLIIKLSSIGIFSVALIFGGIHFFLLIPLLTLWLQDAIWKTFQARIELRIIQLEKLLTKEEIKDESSCDNKAFQFNTEYLKNRPSNMGLIQEYLSNALRPTIAFPHVVLVLILGLIVLINN